VNRYDLELRGMPVWIVREYLCELGGGITQDENIISGPGWTVRLSELEDYQIGSLSVGQVLLQIEVLPEISASFHEALEKKCIRAGG
jgi:hypothetical protein